MAPVIQYKLVGMSPFAPNPEMIQKLKKKEVLEMFMKNLIKDYDKIVALHLSIDSE